MNTTMIFGFVAGFILMAIIVYYNKLVRLKNIVKNAFADIDVWMKKRFDLVGSLVETVKGYAKHETTTLEKIAKIRTDFINAGNDQEKLKANNQLVGSLKTFFAVSEKYPDLKASSNFLKLQKDLAKMEDTIAQARRFFNATSRELNNAVQTFPTNIVAGLFGFKAGEYFQLEKEEESEVVKVDM